MDLEKVKALIELAEVSGLAELEVETDDLSVRVVRPVGAAAGLAPVAVTSANPPLQSDRDAPATGADSRFVRAPMAGTFYQAPSPGAEAFVLPGSTVDTGNTLCIIESMKMMNEIRAPAAGTIVEVLVADGTPVETGQPLFSFR